MPTFHVVEIRSREQLIEQYHRLCGHIARKFVQRWKRKLEAAGLDLADEFGKSGKWETNTPQFASVFLVQKSQDLASAAIVRLMKCPEKYWNQPYYVKRLIVNAIIDEQKAQQKVFEHEWQPPEFGSSTRSGAFEAHDWFDTQPGRDGLAEATRVKFDAAAVQEKFSALSQGERLVIELYFGLNNTPAIKEYAIASKLGRTREWVDRRLKSGLNVIRREIGVNV
jgi:RNA polymerase sigma factor (sigma-70 family)